MDNRQDDYDVLQQMIRDGTGDEQNASHEENASVDTDQYLNLEDEDTGVQHNPNEDTGGPNDQSASGSKKNSKNRGPTGLKNFEGRFVIDEVAEDGQPIEPPKSEENRQKDKEVQQPEATLDNIPQGDLERIAKEAGITVDQLLGREYIESAEEVWKFVPGKELVKPDLVKALPTQMRRFHNWYMKKSATDPHHLIAVRVKDVDYFNGVEIFYLDFKDIYEIYHQGALDISLVSCWVLMEIQMCRKQRIYDVGFMDPIVINQKTILDHREGVRQRVLKFFINQHFKKFILLPYNWGFHLILLIIEMDAGAVIVLDSMRKPTTDYDEVMDVLNDAWNALREIQPGLKKELKLRSNFPCYRQGQGMHICGYCVCEFMHTCVRQHDSRMMRMKDGLLPEDKIKAVQESLIGFINKEIILDTGEFFDTGEPLPPPNDYVPDP